MSLQILEEQDETAQEKRDKIREDLLPISVGEILKRDYLVPFDMSFHELARGLKVPVGRVLPIVRSEGRISVNMALRLEIYLGKPAEYWLACGSDYGLAICRAGQEKKLKRLIRPYFS